MSSSDFVTVFHNASLILALINVRQPVSRTALLDEFGVDREESLKESLQFLTRRKLVKALPHHHYRTTWDGQQSMWSDALVKKRDIQRMWYLSDLSDRSKNRKEGEAS